jgi:cytochrome P450
MKLALLSESDRHFGEKSPPGPRLRHLKDLPGPKQWPLVGNTLQVDLHRLHQNIEAWVQQYGSMMQMRLAGFRLLVISDHTLISTLLRDRPEGFRRPSRMQQIMSDMGMADGVFVAEGERWARQRRMVMASFAPGQVRAYFPALLNVAERLRTRWNKACAVGRPVDLQADLMRFTVDAISGLAFGVDVDTLSSNDDVIQQHLDQIFPTIWRRSHALVPYWKKFKLPKDRALDRSVAAVNQAIRGFIAAARGRLADPARRASPQNLLEAMLVAADEPNSGMSDEDVVGNVFTMLLAGEDTTATSLSWMLYLLSRNPEALSRARDEVDRVLGPLETWTADDMAGLDYLEACIHETMRLKPVGPFNVVETLKDQVINDVLVPKGTSVVMVMRHDCMKDEHFADAAQFKPERWLPEGAALASDRAKHISMPFGAGARICPGRYLALMEIKLAAAMLLQNFGIVSVDTPDGGEAQEHMALTMVPVGLSMTLRQRPPR